MIPDDVVEEVRARADIVDIIGEVVPLKKAGREYKANCPFHEERTPSFYVVPDKGFFKCFGCGKSGDVFGFVMERLGLDFVEAVKHVAARSGVEVKETSRQRDEDDPNRPLYELNAFAQGWFREQLVDPKVGAIARAYLEGRGIGADTAERFGLGYAPDDWHALGEAAAKLGLDQDLMVQVGLLGVSERSSEPYDRFRGRIIFPIESISGKVVAFGGRVLEGDRKDAPKYLNSPESAIYHKGKMLYGMSWAKHAVRREEGALVVEGYMDVVSLAAHGFENVVAPLGTALTPEQAKLLGRYCTRVYLLFDSDSAGLRATFRAADTLLEESLHPAVVTLPPGEDPDTLVRGEGRDALQTYLDDAVDVLDRKLHMLEERDFFTSIERTRQALDRLLPTIRAAKDPALRDIYIANVADRTGVRRETIEAELKRAGRGASRSGPVTQVPQRASPRQPLPAGGAERELLLVLTRAPELVDRAAERLGPEDFEDSHYRAIFEALVADPDLRAPLKGMDPVTSQRLQDILADPATVTHTGRTFEDAVALIRAAALTNQIERLKERLAASADPSVETELLTEKKRLEDERRQIAPADWRPSIHHHRRNPNSNL